MIWSTFAEVSTDPGALELIGAQHLDLYGEVNLALLANPATPDGIESAWHADLPHYLVARTLAAPATSAAARSRILAYKDTVWKSMSTTTLITAAEVRAAVGDRTGTGLPSGHAAAALACPTTDRDVATRAAHAALSRVCSPEERTTVSVQAVERGADIASLAELGALTATYARALRHAPGRSWVEHLRDAQLVPDSTWTTVMSATSDPDVLQVATARATTSDRTGIVYSRLPAHARPDTLTAYLRTTVYIPVTPAFTTLSDEAALTVIHAIANDDEAARQGSPLNSRISDVVDGVLSTVRRDPQMLTELVYALDTTGTAHHLPGVALHPRCPTALRAELLERTGYTPRTAHDADAMTAARAVAAREHGILDVPIQTVARLLDDHHATSARHHLAHALRQDRTEVTAAMITAVAALLPSFPGTVRELLDAGRAIIA